MTEEEKRQKIDEILKRYRSEIDEITREYGNEINNILSEIKSKQIAELESRLGIRK